MNSLRDCDETPAPVSSGIPPNKKNKLRLRPRGDTVVPLYPVTEKSANTTMEKLFNAFPEMVVIYDKSSGLIIACNDKVGKTIGINTGSLDDKPLSSLFNGSTLQKLQVGNTILRNQEMECASGLKLPVDIHIEPIDLDGKEAMMIRIKDLQEDKEIKQVVAGVAHDLNNALSVIFGNAAFLNDQLTESDKGFEEIEGVMSATQRGIRLVRELQNLTSRAVHKPQSIKILPMMEELISSLSYWQSRYGINFEMNCSHDYECSIDLARFTEAIFNLVKNAKDAMPNGGIIKISIQDNPPETTKAQSEENLKKGVYVIIEDNGTGIPRSSINKIFSPTFSTKKHDRKGYGFGLANVLRTIKAHEGDISVESKTGKNSFTRFIIFIPE